MKANIIIYLSSLLLVIQGCNQEKKYEIDSSQIKSEVQQTLQAYIDHANTKGILGVEYYFSKDDRFYWVEDGTVQYPNRKALIDGIQQFGPSVESVNLVVSTSKIEVLDADKVMWYAEYKEDLRLKSGFEFTLDGAMTILLHREDNTWKFLIGHSSIKKPRGGS